jgi:4-amino-4-deoxy-L-arabinose transferase-like glycosyltransferase
MADIADMPTLLPVRNAETIYTRQAPQLWQRLVLGAILLLSIAMNFWLLGQNGYGNLYYASGVRSMIDSWHNFFFVSFDPGGFVTIDKPPLGFWLQALSAKIFGFTPFSIFLPQAICGVLAVLLLYYLVRRQFGVIAGLIAALALAVTPISVVTDRNNTIDGTLALALLLAAWAVIHAAETGKLRWLLLSAVFVGIGFNIKMSEAYLVVPALGVTYLFCAPRKVWTRIWHLALALVVMLVISLSWAVAVDLTPASQRPWVGSTQDNSELSLAFGYNGLNRLHIGEIGGNNGRGGNRSGTGAAQKNNTTTADTAARATTTTDQSTRTQSGNNGNAENRPQQFQGGPFQTGATGPFRLFSASLGGQIAWLLPFALLAIVALAWQRRPNFQVDRQQLGLILWGFWLLTMATFFTLDGNFHQYYMTEMSPGLSALVGIGVVTMWQDYRRPGWRGWLLPIALVATAAAQIYMLLSYPTYERWLSPLIGVLTALVVLALIIFRLKLPMRLQLSPFRIANLVMGIGLFTLLISPTIWAGYSVIHNTENSFPTAGPSAQNNFGGFPNGNARANRQNSANTARNRTERQNAFAGGQFGGFGADTIQTNSALIAYLEAHQGHTRFLLATPSSNMADSIILTTNKPVMAMGGFSGNDPILTTSSLQTLIHNGTVRFFLINAPRTTQGQNGAFGGFGGNRQNALTTWISNNCSVVPTSAWQSSAARPGANQLYDCASARA